MRLKRLALVLCSALLFTSSTACGGILSQARMVQKNVESESTYDVDHVHIAKSSGDKKVVTVYINGKLPKGAKKEIKGITQGTVPDATAIRVTNKKTTKKN